jgi:membrane protein implicated in regulation of membrane protease activity
MGFLESIEFWHWWVLGVILLVMEVLVPGTFFLWMAIAGGIVGVLLLPFPDMDWKIQLLIFSVLSVGAIAAWQVYLRRNPTETADNTLNRRGAQYIGRRVTLDEPLVNGRGRVQIDDTYWHVATADVAGLDAGALITVTGVDGIVLTVEAV